MVLAPAVRDVWTEHPGYQLAWINNVILSGYLGVTAMTMPARFGAVTYDALRNSLGVAGWGAAITGYCLLIIASAVLPARAIELVFLAGGTMYLLIAIWFAIGLGDPAASPWGPAVFASFGAWQLQQWVAYRQAARIIVMRREATAANE